MASEVQVKVVVSALFYEKGKTGNDVLHRESYKVPIPVSNFKTLKSFLEFLR